MSWATGQHIGEDIPTENALQDSGAYDITSLHQNMPFMEECDDLQELMDRPGSLSTYASMPGSPTSAERAIRRRSSKACDQCRKSKCKCELTAHGEPCKSCVMLSTPCTFLGPSRKRGPPKGYIDAIEARLHQTEALVGILLSSQDERAQSLLRDIAQDPLASAIINRVDHSPYGSQGQKRTDPGAGKTKTAHLIADVRLKVEGDQLDLHSTHPSHEWQVQVIAMLDAIAAQNGGEADYHYTYDRNHSQDVASNPPRLQVVMPPTPTSENLISPTRRQRRRIGADDGGLLPNGNIYATQSPPSARPGRTKIPADNSIRSLSPLSEYHWTGATTQAEAEPGRRRDCSSHDSFSTDSEEDLAGAAGQLSLNEEEQVRYHGKASGLHLLGDKDRIDSRNEGGIWRFPKAGVWPPLPSGAKRGSSTTDDDFLSQLPEPAMQKHLVDLYFTHVHPSFPVIHRTAFFDLFQARKAGEESPRSATDPAKKPTKSHFSRGQRRIPNLLLFAMFAIAARYSPDTDVPPPDGTILWAAGDQYLDRAKTILNGLYASSRTTTVQALLLMGYREIGAGAMAQAWIYIGMAIRMAQDLGLHRSADGWARADLGGQLFNEWELQERKRIWYGCVIMDKYVSTYIGRPLSIFEWDFDTPLPSEEDIEEFEDWQYIPSKSDGIGWDPNIPKPRVISCFNASAKLSGLLSMVVQTIYAVRPATRRHTEVVHLESLLDKWYIDLPEHLRHESGPSKLPVPPPHILTLHMQYWCTVLLLHRPFIRNPSSTKSKASDHSDDGETRVFFGKSYEMCVGAANHITSIVSVYIDNYSLDHCNVFLCYYIFTASIMHIMTLTTYPADPQAQIGLTKCIDALGRMRIVWPSAGRALELLTGSKVPIAGPELSKLSNHPDRHKRVAEQHLDVEDAFNRAHFITDASGNLISRPQYIPVQYGGAQDVYTQSGELQPGLAPVPQVPFSYERWPNAGAVHHPFPNTLSTSVLPQLYSTGLVDEQASSGVRLPTTHDRHGGHGGEHARYPQYWHDYSAYPQLGAAYETVPSLMDQVQGQQQQQQQRQHPVQQAPSSAQYHHPMYPPQGATYLQ